LSQNQLSLGASEFGASERSRSPLKWADLQLRQAKRFVANVKGEQDPPAGLQDSLHLSEHERQILLINIHNGIESYDARLRCISRGVATGRMKVAAERVCHSALRFSALR